MGYLNLREQLAFYRKYHYDETNVNVHIAFVPLILAAGYTFGTVIPLPSYITRALPAALRKFSNLGVATSIGYAGYWSLLDALFGIPAGIGAIAIATAATKLFAKFPKRVVAGASLATFVVSFAFQIWSHKVYEKRAPALTENLTQALVLAPFFVVFEVANLLGIRTDIMRDVDAQVAPEVAAFKAKLAAEEKAKKHKPTYK